MIALNKIQPFRTSKIRVRAKASENLSLRIDDPRQTEAVLGQLRGSKREVACTNCSAKGKGVFTECVSVMDTYKQGAKWKWFFDQACCNCHFRSETTNCSVNLKNGGEIPVNSKRRFPQKNKVSASVSTAQPIEHSDHYRRICGLLPTAPEFRQSMTDSWNSTFDQLTVAAVNVSQTNERNQYEVYKLLLLQALHDYFGESDFMKIYIPEGTLPHDLYSQIDIRSRLDSLIYAKGTETYKAANNELSIGDKHLKALGTLGFELISDAQMATHHLLTRNVLYNLSNAAEKHELEGILLKVLGKWYSERIAMLTKIPLGSAGSRLYRVDAIGTISWEGRVYRDILSVACEERMEGADDAGLAQNAPDDVPAVQNSGNEDSRNEDSNQEMKDPTDSGGETPRQSSDEDMIHSSAVKKGARKDGPWEESESEGYQPLSDENDEDNEND